MRQSVSRRQSTFADLEFLAQHLALDPVLERLSTFLDQHAELVDLVHRDLVRGLTRPGSGRQGLSAEQALRALRLQRIKDWDLRELRERIADGFTLRQFTAFWCDRVPRHQAFHRAFVKLTPATMQAVNHAVVTPPSTSGSKTARGCGSTRRWWRPTSTGRPIPSSLGIASAS